MCSVQLATSIIQLHTWHQVLIDPVVKLAKRKLAPVANTRSYGIMPASSIVNGTLILRMNEHYWALQSPREQAEYLQNK